ncbi:stage II sporulation protein E [Leptospira perolatii]|uniref:Stage II sporulation protein E n=1 Tax=Leptospira perolatii TaxID=2023191 RepID=A0A2M9ZT77_9LEPT|nr:PP2C family protein-serine/threonine phosphatase [Leptospira perolatii]PJZ71565.1 stage II sporulation protein E [Leptospira perolatii]PJZ75181.1 stage II sporulation protein E [Leptospira perolatii]
MLYFNSWAISYLICCIFTFIIFVFLATLKNKARYTSALSIQFCLVFLINLGFLISVLFPYPWAAYHRLLTGPSAIFGTIFLSVFSYLYPRNDRPREARIVLSIMVSLAVISVGYFFYQIFTKEAEFNFAGQAYNFPKGVGEFLAALMLSYIGVMLYVQIQKIRTAESSEERKALIQMSLSLAITYLVPVLSNLLFQKGVISRNSFQQLYVGFTIIGYFTLTIVFINNTVDRTSFMTKIVGITVVTCLLFAQGFSTILNLRNEKLFDEISLKEVNSFSKSGIVEGTDISRIVSLPDGSQKPKLLANRTNLVLELSAPFEKILLNREAGNFLKRIPEIYLSEDKEKSGIITPTPESLFYSYYIRDESAERTLQFSFSYLKYREFLDDTNRWIAILTICLVLIILTLFPVFFNRSLVKPMNELIHGVGEVNLGNLYVKIPVLVQDEIGYLSGAFNGMVQSILEGRTKLEEYADTLEAKVEERTKEVTEKMEEIQALKVQQDGDYYLTSLLSRPLMSNLNRSKFVSTSFYIEQKKKFNFRNKDSELGGDLCISGDLLFGNKKELWTVFLNADAMGKSMQGAGGAIVLGTAMNNILTRSSGEGKSLNVNPEDWLKQTFRELDDIFRTFDGVMMASAILGLINEKTGQMLYFNAEHPWAVLFRDGKSSFLERELTLRKLGSPSEMNFRILEYTLKPGDVVFLGSDGKDDINILKDDDSWAMNEDEHRFLVCVEKASGELDKVVTKLHDSGMITDDLSLIRIGFQENGVGELEEISTANLDVAKRKFMEAKALLQQKEFSTATILLEEALRDIPEFQEASRLLAQVYYDAKDYSNAAKWFRNFLTYDGDSTDVWFLLSVCYKYLKDYTNASEAAEKVRVSQPHRLSNLINLADNYRQLGRLSEARSVLDAAISLDPQNSGVRKLDEILKSKGYPQEF